MDIETFKGRSNEGRPKALPPSSNGFGYNETPIMEMVDVDAASWFTKIALNYVRMQREETETTAVLFKVLFGVKYIISRASRLPEHVNCKSEMVPALLAKKETMLLGIAGSSVKKGEWVSIDPEGNVVPTKILKKKKLAKKKPVKKKKAKKAKKRK